MSVSLPNLLHGGFTLDFTMCLDDLAPGKRLLDCRSETGGGWWIVTAEGATLRIELNDGRNPPESWATDLGLLRSGQEHRITFIVDGGPNLILVLVDGVLCDGGDQAQRRWGRFSGRLTDLGGEATLQIGSSLRARLHHLHLYFDLSVNGPFTRKRRFAQSGMAQHWAIRSKGSSRDA